MSLDFQQLHKQVKQMGADLPARESRLRGLRERVIALLEGESQAVERLRAKVESAALQAPNLRCARPESEPLTARRALPPLPERVHILAADGSQINPDRHRPVEFYLINIGAVGLGLGSPDSPQTYVESHLHYGDDLYTQRGLVSEGLVTLKRDLLEREFLADLTARVRRDIDAEAAVVTLTDGPMELWGAKGREGGGPSTFRESLDKYKRALNQMHDLGAIPGGYVDKPRADLVVRLLELASLPDDRLDQAGKVRPFQGVTDADLFRHRLEPGERSAVFGLQSQSVSDYTGPLALHFAYLNVGSPGRPWLARVEFPAWVAQDEAKLDALHACLIQQCRTLGSRAYPYVLHRAHEAALVSQDERDQLIHIILLERRRQGLAVDEVSQKQAVKDLGGRARYRRVR